MDVFLAGQKVRLSDADLIGEGGEARVFKSGTRALKIFHAPTDQKLQKLARFPVSMPDGVARPERLVSDRAGRIVGYEMALVDGATDFARLANRKWRLGVMGNPMLTGLFEKLHTLVKHVHAAQVQIGDFNDGNVLFANGTPHLIDADSMQFGGMPCSVGHERFLDPLLYGVDLTSAPRFSEGSDWYAFAVLLFQSLLSVHPFGGTHPKLATLLRRAEARHSLFRSDVTRPRQSVAPAVLPDDLQHWFLSVFEKDARQAFPASLLQLSWAKCGCGTEHARSVCPDCRALGPLVTRRVLRSHGRCISRSAFETHGRIVTAAMQGGLRFLAQADGVLRREDGTVIASTLARPHAWLAGSITWLADASGHVEKWQGDRLIERTTTGTRVGTPIFAASTSVAIRETQGLLIDHLSGSHVGPVLEGQTWLWLGERLGVGFYRAGGVTMGVLIRAGKSGLKVLNGLTWSGRIVSANAVFDAQHALLTVQVDDGGRDVVHRFLIDETATIIARSSSQTIGNAALMNGRVVLATDAGLVALKNDSGQLIEAALFADSQPFVSAGDELLPNTDGSLFVVGARDITQLTLT